ncbi:hypothetical protein ACKXGD_14885, partial [Enterococcus lactis]|uniref:hypothetical protein n=1 Tax=Enterococcus lactis TaxID=357441 RepID=UPI0039083FE8
IFLYPKQSTHYYCGLLGTNRIHQVPEILLTKFDKYLKVHILQERVFGPNSIHKETVFQFVKTLLYLE